MPLLQMLLAFLAGAGAKPMADTLTSLMRGQGGGRGAMGGDPNRPHRGGVKMQADPSNPGGAGMTPSAMQQQNPQDLLKLLMLMKQMQGQDGPPQQ
jgi:hypothetical protein